MADAKVAAPAAKEGGAAKPKASQKAREDKKASRWDLKLCVKFAKRFESEEAWAVGAPSSYKAAVARNLVAECTKHMKAAPASKKKKSA